jgi:hypothetical protein
MEVGMVSCVCFEITIYCLKRLVNKLSLRTTLN